ncbi:MAG: PepSY domain-containing protein [Pseudomonadota bacterium]|jgi:hypothetical protein
MAAAEPGEAALRRWHRRLGVAAALFLVLLAFTGFALNHVAALQLDRLVIRSPLVLRWYGVELPERIEGFAVGEHWLSRVGEGLFLDRVQVATCGSRLVGAVRFGEELAAACEQELLLFTADGLLVDRIDATYRLPVPLETLGVAGGQLALRAKGQALRVEPEAPAFIPLADAEVAWARPQPLPETLVAALAPFAAGDEITLERLVLDLHSGRLLGLHGVWLMDAVALAMVILALSGLASWRNGLRRPR